MAMFLLSIAKFSTTHKIGMILPNIFLHTQIIYLDKV